MPTLNDINKNMFILKLELGSTYLKILEKKCTNFFWFFIKNTHKKHNKPFLYIWKQFLIELGVILKNSYFNFLKIFYFYWQLLDIKNIIDIL